jgi:hypothetical protein
VKIMWKSVWRENCEDYVGKCVEGELWRLCGTVSGGRIVEIRWKSVWRENWGD